MNELRLRIIIQTGLGLILSLFFGLLLQASPIISIMADTLIFTSTPEPTLIPAYTSTPMISPLPSLTPTVTMIPPFVTINQVYSIKVVVYRQKSPEVINVQGLPEGRLVVTQPGESKIEMLDSTGEVVYSQFFNPVFLSGEPMQAVEQRTMTFILPANLEGVKVRITTPQGEVEYDLPANP